MPSPIAHTAAAYLIYRATHSGALTKESLAKRRVLGPFLLIVFLSLLPDFDFLPGLLTGNFDAFHNTISHSLLAGLIVALFGAIVLRWLWSGSVLRWFIIVLVSYELHVVMDYFTFGRGVMLLWPFSMERHQPPVILFYGLHRSAGLITIKHLWTILSEGVFAAAVVLATNVLANRWANNASRRRMVESESSASTSTSSN